MKRKFLAMLTVGVLGIGMALTGCGSSEEEQTTSAEESGAALDTAALEEELAQYFDLGENYSVEGATEIDVKSTMAGKKLFILPANYAVQFDEVTCSAMKDICDNLGIESYIYTADGTVDSWVQGMETAVNQGYDAILAFSGVDMDLVSSQVEYAEENGIPVIDCHFHDFADQDSCTATYCLAADYEKFGRVIALRAIQSAGADGNYLIVTSQDLDASLAMEKGVESALSDYAPDAKYTYVNVNLADWATKMQTEVTNALNADPTIDYVISMYDSNSTYVTAAIEAVGATGTIKTSTYNGTPFALDLVNSGAVDADLGECLDLMAYCLLDQTFRILDGQEPLEDENAPLVLWTSDNVEATIGEDGTAGFGGYDTSYISYYEELWGVAE
ncbi:MAG: substrate-binding domain-containing protein [Eubacterium sp.]|nr:substrate-binding domain-containing protein [Eubacterium sp.]